MTAKNLPSPELLRKLLRYEPDTGKLYWRERTPDMFVDGKRSAEWCCKSWNIRFSGKEAFTAFRNGYLYGSIFCRSYSAHRVIWAIYFGEWPLDDIDHINGGRSDNRIKNLRSVARSENMKNKKLPLNNTSGVMGVFWANLEKRWYAQITCDGKLKHLGKFLNKDDAIAARKAAEVKYGFHANHGRQR